MGQIIKHDPKAMKRKGKFFVESVNSLIEIRKRMSEIIVRLQESFDGGPDAATFRTRSLQYIKELEKIEKSLIEYVDVFGKVNTSYGKLNTDYSDKQRRREDEFIQIQA